jgi:hypothetical protein
MFLIVALILVGIWIHCNQSSKQTGLPSNSSETTEEKEGFANCMRSMLGETMCFPPGYLPWSVNGGKHWRNRHPYRVRREVFDERGDYYNPVWVNPYSDYSAPYVNYDSYLTPSGVYYAPEGMLY